MFSTHRRMHAAMNPCMVSCLCLQHVEDVGQEVVDVLQSATEALELKRKKLRDMTPRPLGQVCIFKPAI